VVDWPYRYERRIPVVLRDCDGIGHVNNAVYATYIEIARTEYVFRLTGGRRLEDFDFILARSEMDFRAQATLGDELLVRMRPVRIGGKSWDLETRILQADTERVVVESRAVLVSYDFAGDRTIPVPEAFRAKLEGEMRAWREGREPWPR
jgi:acyl-CoA thioester hydrolase